ncbi:Uncharacterized protein PBTT_06817 [Plasmodiophora brassicae]
MSVMTGDLLFDLLRSRDLLSGVAWDAVRDAIGPADSDALPYAHVLFHLYDRYHRWSYGVGYMSRRVVNWPRAPSPPDVSRAIIFVGPAGSGKSALVGGYVRHRVPGRVLARLDAAVRCEPAAAAVAQCTWIVDRTMAERSQHRSTIDSYWPLPGTSLVLHDTPGKKRSRSRSAALMGLSPVATVVVVVSGDRGEFNDRLPELNRLMYEVYGAGLTPSIAVSSGAADETLLAMLPAPLTFCHPSDLLPHLSSLPMPDDPNDGDVVFAVDCWRGNPLEDGLILIGYLLQGVLNVGDQVLVHGWSIERSSDWYASATIRQRFWQAVTITSMERCKSPIERASASHATVIGVGVSRLGQFPAGQQALAITSLDAQAFFSESTDRFRSVYRGARKRPVSPDPAQTFVAFVQFNIDDDQVRTIFSQRNRAVHIAIASARAPGYVDSVAAVEQGAVRPRSSIHRVELSVSARHLFLFARYTPARPASMHYSRLLIEDQACIGFGVIGEWDVLKNDPACFAYLRRQPVQFPGTAPEKAPDQATKEPRPDSPPTAVDQLRDLLAQTRMASVTADQDERANRKLWTWSIGCAIGSWTACTRRAPGMDLAGAGPATCAGNDAITTAGRLPSARSARR